MIFKTGTTEQTQEHKEWESLSQYFTSVAISRVDVEPQQVNI